MDKRLALTIPANEIESSAWDQIKAALALPFLSRLAIMPDVHAGFDLVIGGVALLDGYVWPGAVGFDCGCGVCHVNLGDQGVEFFSSDASRRELFEHLGKNIPVGFKFHEIPMSEALVLPFPNASGDKELSQRVNSKIFKQINTLGGGNHFLECGFNGLGELGITIHSGSRNPGHSIGGYWMKRAKAEGAVYGKIAVFPVDSELGQAYLADLSWALEYALLNRRLMMKEVLRALGLGDSADLILNEGMINENHNHAVVQPGGQVLHRKGATPADKDQIGIIPANQRDGVWITRGLGNEDFLSSASHGCGRVMGRNQAKKTLSVDKFKAQMAGIIARTDAGVLDEAPDAYKPIDQVLAAQEGILVNVIDHFKPVMVLKG
ncbi:MAG: RtcB family protein [Proteobacteria bacterium]|nr:RtcB family protein [Pseudomonadota bacterium]